MGRRKKYKPTRGLFKLPSKKPPRPPAEAVLVSGEYCEYCLKPLSNRKKRQGNRFCNYKCSNRFKGEKQRGVSRPHRRAREGLDRTPIRNKEALNSGIYFDMPKIPHED